jgi:putative transposase
VKNSRSRYYGHRFPPEIISYAVWLYHRFCISFRDVEDLLAEREIIVSYESIRLWCLKFGPDYVRKLKRRQDRFGDIWYLDEVFVRINGPQQYLWRAVDQDGDVIDILVQSRRDQRAAERFLRRLVRGQGREPLRMITDKLKSYGAAKRKVLPGVTHDTGQYANNRAELSHQPTRAKRATNAPVQIFMPGTTIPIDAWHDHESVSSGTPTSAFIESSTPAIAIIRDLADHHRGLRFPTSISKPAKIVLFCLS